MTVRDRICRAEELIDLAGEIQGDPEAARRRDALTTRARKILEGVQRSPRAGEFERLEVECILDDMKRTRYPLTSYQGSGG